MFFISYIWLAVNRLPFSIQPIERTKKFPVLCTNFQILLSHTKKIGVRKMLSLLTCPKIIYELDNIIASMSSDCCPCANKTLLGIPTYHVQLEMLNTYTICKFFLRVGNRI